jgi:hypothetical protein
MRNRITNYCQTIKIIIDANSPDTNWESVLNDLLIQIGFFQHERLIHLIVTVAFAILEMISVALTLLSGNSGCFILDIAFLCLLIPYIRHYYLLENKTQKLYEYYDSIRLHLNRTK